MRVLVLSFYYPPDLSAGSFRTGALVKALRELLPEDSAVDVVSTMPNRYRSYSVKAPELESIGNVTIRRLRIPAHRNRMCDQAVTFAVFSGKALQWTRNREYDVVFATSSRLFTGFLGALIARRKRTPFYLDIRDIFAETISDVLGRSPLRVVLPLINAIERYTLHTATVVNLVSEGFLQYFTYRYPGKRYAVLPNGIDEEFLRWNFAKPRSRGTTKILYAGNIGEGQALDRIIPGLARTMGDEAEFLIIGDGGARKRLEEALRQNQVSNVRLLPPVDRATLMKYYRDADVLFLHLGEQRAFLRVLPSKVFEYAATGKPIWAGVNGFAARFISNIPNAQVFAPGDVDHALRAYSGLNLASIDRSDFVREYRRSSIMKVMANQILECASTKTATAL